MLDFVFLNGDAGAARGTEICVCVCKPKDFLGATTKVVILDATTPKK